MPCILCRAPDHPTADCLTATYRAWERGRAAGEAARTLRCDACAGEIGEYYHQPYNRERGVFLCAACSPSRWPRAAPKHPARRDNVLARVPL